MAADIQAYFIQCITNMHVGSGDATYAVIDKLVQRDPVTGYPTIHPSSLKGALREHFENEWKDDDSISEIFGAEQGDTSGDNKTGNFKFLGADLVALPVRCTHQQYALTFSPQLTIGVNRKSNILLSKNIFKEDIEPGLYSYTTNSEEYLEDYIINKRQYIRPIADIESNLFQNQFACVNDVQFCEFAKNLPVIARNYLVNGVSKNLWYEEVVPHQTVFVTYVASTNPELHKAFEAALLKDVIQIGGNATVGYGFCKFQKIKLS